MEHTTSAFGQSFAPGSVVMVTLNAPREKFFGVILAVSPAGVALRGVDLNSLEDFMRQVREGDPVRPGAVFFPMHRIERMEMDVRNADIPSMQERFETKTGRRFSDFFLSELPAAGKPN